MSFSYCPDCYNSDYRYLKGRQKKEQDKVQQNAVSESETDSAGDSDTEIGAIYLPQQTTEGTEKTYVTTTSSVNMREKPDKNAKYN